MATQVLKITEGPSKWDLMLALFDHKPRSRRVTFKLEGGQEFQLLVLRVQAEDGSGESWNIDGHAEPLPGKILPIGIKWGPSSMIYFRTDSRKGHLRLE